MSETLAAAASGITFGLSLILLWNVGKIGAALKRLEEKLDSLSKK